MTTSEATANNGVNVEALLGARELVSEKPEMGQFRWRASSKWIGGTHSRSDVEGFFGFTDEQKHHTKFSYDVDHPEQFASQDIGPTPVELILVGLAGCLTAGVAAVASQRNIQLHSVEATLEGEMDLAGILGADPDVRNGFSGITVKYSIDANCDPEDVRALVAQSQKRSAVYDIITNPTSVRVDVV